MENTSSTLLQRFETSMRAAEKKEAPPPNPVFNEALNAVSGLKTKIEERVAALGGNLPDASLDKMSRDAVGQKESRARLQTMGERLNRWGSYFQNFEGITETDEGLKDAEKNTLSGETENPAVFEGTHAKAAAMLRSYEERSLPQRLVSGAPEFSKTEDYYGPEYLEAEEKWLQLTREQQQRFNREREERKNPELKQLREENAAQKTQVTELTRQVQEQRERANRAEAAQKAAEEQLARLRGEQMEQLAELQEQLEKSRQQFEKMAVEDQQIIKDLESKMKVGQTGQSSSPIDFKEIEEEQLATPPPGENPEEPELQMDDAVLEKVETRNPLQRIRDGVANGLRAWWDNIDPRKIGEKDRIWKIGLAIGVAEGIAVNLAPIPGGRFAINAINFLAGQGFYTVGEGLRQAEVASTNKTFEGNEAIQRILDVNDRYINASRNIRNCLFGVSAGITYTSVLGMAWDIGQHLINPTLAAEALTGKATAAVGGHEVFNPVVTIPDHGNFWNAWHVNSTNWADLKNGTTHTDVIKDMVVKLARHNGHELGLVHAGDQIELGKVLNSEQLELVKKAAAAKSYAEYSQAIRPAYHVLLKK